MANLGEIDAYEVFKELKEKGITKYFFYTLLSSDEDVKRYVRAEGTFKKRYKVKKEDVNTLKQLILRKWNERRNFLTAFEVSKELERKAGISISPSSIRYYVQKSFIPQDLVVKQKKGKLFYYYFKPQVVDFLLEKLGNSSDKES